MGMLKNLAFSVLSTKKRFERISEKGQWGSAEETISGSGSTLANTENLRSLLPKLIAEIGAKSILDVPCGDFHWMRHVLPECPAVESYIGMDIVPGIIQRNSNRFKDPRILFSLGDLISGPLPNVDLVINRDSLIHFSFRDIDRTIANLARSGSTYLMTTTHEDVSENGDIVTGRWRPINLMMAPFFFPYPTRLIDENEKGKSLALWRIEDLPRIKVR